MSKLESDLPLGSLPPLTDPQRYTGLYIVDFGDCLSVGYLAAEVITLFDSGRFPQMRAFRIHRALTDGTMSLAQVPRDRFRPGKEEVLFFLQDCEPAARDDFDTLRDLAEGKLPCPVRIELAETPGREYPFLTALIYPAEYTEHVSQFLLSASYEGGQTVEAGTQALAAYRQIPPHVLERVEISPAPGKAARSLEDLLVTRRYATQR